MNVDIVPVWKQVTPQLGEELMAFWRSNKAIVDDTAAATRATQAVCVARDQAGAICGVGTAVIRVLPRLRQPMYYYRQYFARPCAGARQLNCRSTCRRSKSLQATTHRWSSPESLGILLEVENASSPPPTTHAHEPAYDATFIGYSPRGRTLRVSYFDGAVLQPPAALRVPVSGTRAMHARSKPATAPATASSITSSTIRRTSSRS